MRRALSFLLLAALFVASCSGDDTSSDGTVPDPGATPDAPEATPTPDGPSSGGTLRLAMARPGSLDPAVLSLTDAGQLVLADLLYDTLTRVDGAGLPIPGLAAFSADEDLVTWTFDLGDASFAGGRPVTAADAKASLERIIAAGTTSPAALRLEAVRGWDAFVTGAAPGVEGLVADDDTTLRVVLDEPFSTLPLLLASPAYAVVAAETLDGAAVEVRSSPLGSGSFIVATPEPDLLRFTPRPDAAVLVDAVEVRFHDSAADALASFLDGGADWAPVPATELAQAGNRAEASPFHGLLHLGFNVADEVFAKPGLRQAVAHAIDRAAIAESVYGITAEPLARLVPTEAGGVADQPCAGVCDHDPAAAADLVTFIYPDGAVPTLRLDVEEGERTEALAALVEADLEAVGIPVEVRASAFDEYEQLVAAGEQQLFLFGWIALGRSGDQTLDPLFSSGSLDNVTGYTDPETDFFLGAIASEPDPAVRSELIASAEAEILADVPAVPLIQFTSLAVVAPRVRDLDRGIDGTFDVGRVWLEGD